MRVAPIRGEVHPAEENAAEVDVEAAIDADEPKDRSVHIRKFNRLKYSIHSVICNLEQVTDVPYPLRTVNSAQKKLLEKSIRENGFETSYDVLTVTVC